jgi:hypothetical protein
MDLNLVVIQKDAIEEYGNVKKAKRAHGLVVQEQRNASERRMMM